MSKQPDEIAIIISELQALMQKTRSAAHDLAKSFSDHPDGCIYCKAQQRTALTGQKEKE